MGSLKPPSSPVCCGTWVGKKAKFDSLCAFMEMGLLAWKCLCAWPLEPNPGTWYLGQAA